MSDEKSYVVEPLTCICKLALLHYMPEHTKVAINHHVLCIQPYSYYQWIERIKNGDSRIDISNLNAAVIRAIKWYIIEGPDQVEMTDEVLYNIRNITEYAILGLRKMQSGTYQNDPAIAIIIQYFINLLRTALDGEWNEESTVKIETTDSSLASRIKNHFDAQTITSVSRSLSDASTMTSPDDVTALINCAHNLLINRDTIFLKLMREFNTTL
jgi:hypothetical protein